MLTWTVWELQSVEKKIMFEAIDSSQPVPVPEQLKTIDGHPGICLSEQSPSCGYHQSIEHDKAAENMLQLLNAVNKANGGNQPLNLDRNDISVVVDDSFCLKGNGEQRWQCNVCPKYYATKNNLVTHLLGHYGVKPFACAVCNKTFNQATRLKFHMMSHKGKQPYTCSVCQRSFAQLVHLKRHVLTHENKQPYSCKACAKGFALLSELHGHLELHKRPPTVDTPFMFVKEEEEAEEESVDLRCDLCGRKFLFPSQMKDHMLSHTQVRRFECAVCNMKFLKVHHLKAHCLTHSDIRPHKCDLCGRAFTLKGNLIRHLLTHTKERAFECDICGKRFSQRQTLKTHMVMHADTKPFSCQVCGKALARAHNLKSHMALHRSEKPYKCPLCNSAFTMKGNLHRHYKEKHKDAIKSTLGLDAQKSGTAILVSSQYFAPGNRGPRMDDELNILNFATFAHELPRKRKKAAPKKRKSDKRGLAPSSNAASQPIAMPVSDLPGGCGAARKAPLMHPPPPSPPPNAGGSLANTFQHSVLNYYCNDASCACKFQGQIGYNQHLMHKLHSLHTAIDSLALTSGQPNDQLTALHVAIDEMVNLTHQRQAQHNNFG